LGDVTIAAVRESGGTGYDPGAVGAEARQTDLAPAPATMDVEGCVTCHVATPVGKPSRVVLADLASRHPLDELLAYLTRPNPPMPPKERDAAT